MSGFINTIGCCLVIIRGALNQRQKVKVAYGNLKVEGKSSRQG